MEITIKMAIEIKIKRRGHRWAGGWARALSFANKLTATSSSSLTCRGSIKMAMEIKIKRREQGSVPQCLSVQLKATAERLTTSRLTTSQPAPFNFPPPPKSPPLPAPTNGAPSRKDRLHQGSPKVDSLGSWPA